MSVTDEKRLDPSIFQIDPRMRTGWYSDHYFKNVVEILSTLAQEGYTFAGECPSLAGRGADVSKVDVGNIEVEMQMFTKREPFSVVCGTDHAVAIFRECTGYVDDGEFHNTFDEIELEAVHDGAKVLPWVPAIKARGRYRDFALLETPVLGALARRTRIATNVYEAMTAAAGKPVFMFGARFDIPEAQAGDGYAYKVAVERYNADLGSNVPALVTTGAQGDWWGEKGGGTTSHSFVLSFLGDTTESMIQFARILPPDVKRIALVDTNNDCVGDSVRCAMEFFGRWRALKAAGEDAEAQRYVLFGVRCDTAGDVRDVSVEPVGDLKRERGVVPQLVRKVRSALDGLARREEIPADARDEARQYFQNVRIVVSGGFDPDKIAWFEDEDVPADVFGIGSFLMDGPGNDFTADVVRVKIDGTWYDMAKVGRRAIPNPDLRPVK